MPKFGLLGKTLKHSFSKGYFTEKFDMEQLEDYSYANYEIESIDDFSALWDDPMLFGMNVTIPYKSAVIPFLEKIEPRAKAINAVNTIVREGDQLIGYNSDIPGFQNSLLEFLPWPVLPQRALILGTGGAAQAVKFVLGELAIKYHVVSRNPSDGQIGYDDLTKEKIQHSNLIINTTPLGMFPKIDEKPHIPYVGIGSDHFLFDLVYNPEKTLFLRSGQQQGAQIQNGHRMLILQAEKSWEIWNSYLNQT